MHASFYGICIEISLVWMLSTLITSIFEQLGIGIRLVR